MIATASHSRSTSSSWWLENTTGTPAAASSRSTPLSTSTPTGSRPENGSSSTSTSGSCTSAAASCTRCWLPSESVSARSSARSAEPEPLEPALGRARAPRRVVAVQPREVDELVAHPHLRVQPALLRHVAEAPRASRRRRGRAAPADLAARRARARRGRSASPWSCRRRWGRRSRTAVLGRRRTTAPSSATVSP